MYIHVFVKKYQLSFSLINSSRLFNSAADASFIKIVFSKTRLIFCVLSSRMFKPASVSDITVCLLSFASLERLTSFLITNRSMILGTFELFSIIRQAISFTHISSGDFPFRILSTLYCSWVNPKLFSSLLIKVLSHQAVYKIFSPALWVSFLKFTLCIACSSFTTQMYVHTCNFPNKKKSRRRRDHYFHILFTFLQFPRGWLLWLRSFCTLHQYPHKRFESF